ncbi:MAG TPA: SDR family NAD(P)-dependent oxidoreductase, partial [Thermofilum sp.]|nr:SDR family NAD(P)-dependent oxidoreductase [Thermofilum sp.]
MLRGKVAIVTGSGQGIGAAIAWKLGSLGARVVIAEIDEYKGSFRERWLKERGIDSFFVKTDVSDEEQVRRMVSEAVRRYGKIDILVSNAGIGIS